MPDGAVIIAAITSCTNTSNPRNVVAAGLLAKKANQLGLKRQPWVKPLSRPARKSPNCTWKRLGCSELEQLGFGIVAYACTTCNGMSGALNPRFNKKLLNAISTLRRCRQGLFYR
uniref:aconitase family protein n=1 Tax=Vibrio cholerae TaxID=666 RepID=UPI003F5838A2